jgi:hypothetical protein
MLFREGREGYSDPESEPPDMRTVKIHRVERVWCENCNRSVRVWVSLPQWYARTWMTPTGQCPECRMHIRYTLRKAEAVVWRSRRDA